MATNGLGQSMIGSNAPGGVKKRAKTPAGLKGTKVKSAGNPSGRTKKMKLASGATTGIMVPPQNPAQGGSTRGRDL